MKRYLVMVIGALVGALAQHSALAQAAAAADAATTSTGAAAAPAEKDTLAVVVVTAEKRQTSAQNTPVSLAVYSGDDLVKRGAIDIASLTRADSSLDLSYSTGLPIIAIRGVSSENVTEIGDPAVSIATDGVFNNRPYGVFEALYDIAQVEVLRGPQGTLFGRNSTGGTVNIITQRPTDTDTASITGDVGNYNLVAFNGYANVAVSDELQVRLSFLSRSHSGYINNYPATDRGEDADLHSGRLQVAYEPTDSLKFWLLGQFTEEGGTGIVEETIPFTYINGVGGEPVHDLPPNVGDGRNFPTYGQTQQKLQSTDVRGSAVYTFPDGISLNYLGGYNAIRYYRRQAVNPYYLGDAFPGIFPTIVPFIYENTEKPSTINQELRLASPADQSLTWQAGVYFFQEDSSVNAQTVVNPDSSIQAQGIAFLEPVVNSYSRAGYGTIGYSFTDRFKVTAGARYTYDNRERVGTFVLDPTQTGLPFVLNLPYSGTAQSSKTTWSVDGDYQLTRHNMIYAKISTGYKTGGFNNATSQYGPETVLSYEAGSKNRFLDNHLEVNADIYLMNYKDQQVSEFVAGAESSGSITVNAGRSNIYGLETNLAYQDEVIGKIQLSANYLHARYSEFVESAGWDSSVNLNLAGNTPPLSPTASLSGEYDRPFSVFNGATVTPRVSFKYQSAVYFAANDFPDERQGGYGLVDLGIDYAPAKGNWLLGVYVNNVGNKRAFSDAEEFYTFNNYNFAFIPPLTYGIRLTADF